MNMGPGVGVVRTVDGECSAFSPFSALDVGERCLYCVLHRLGSVTFERKYGFDGPKCVRS